MKTVEEMRVSVLAECERVCKDRMQCYGIGDGLKISKSSSQYTIEYQDNRGSWWILATISKDTESSESLILTFYLLLGLSERDAIADTKAFYESLFAELRQSDLQLVEIYAQAEVGRLQAEKRNAALVAVLEYLLKSARDARIADDTMRSVMWDVCEQALAANEKGGNG